MAIERVKEYFRQYDMEERIIELSESSATVELAAQALGCEPARKITFFYGRRETDPHYLRRRCKGG